MRAGTTTAAPTPRRRFPPADGDKLNATYALGGPKCLVKVIQKMSGLKIGHFVGMDFAGFESMVNEIGGVKVCTTQPLEDGVLGTVLPQAGTQMLDGKTALNYRPRQTCRGGRQRRLRPDQPSAEIPVRPCCGAPCPVRCCSIRAS